MAAICYYGNVMATTRWRLCVALETLSQHFLHLQQYSRRLNLFVNFFSDEYKRMEEASREQEHLEKKECPKPPIDQ